MRCTGCQSAPRSIQGVDGMDPGYLRSHLGPMGSACPTHSGRRGLLRIPSVKAGRVQETSLFYYGPGFCDWRWDSLPLFWPSGRALKFGWLLRAPTEVHYAGSSWCSDKRMPHSHSAWVLKFFVNLCLTLGILNSFYICNLFLYLL